MLDVFPDCGYEIISFEVQGNRHIVEKTLKVEPAGSYNAGGIGIRHRVEARLVNSEGDDLNPQKSIIRKRALFLEFNKWFVEVRVVA